MDRRRPLVLCVLDGWGYRPESVDNAVALGRTPVFDRLWASAPHALLECCGEEVGLPAGQIGNSEVGHMNLGAGRVVFQDLPMIDRAIADGALAVNPALGGLIAALKTSGGRCHLMGLASPGGVHSHQNHMVALARAVATAGVPVVIHAFTDGRDVAPQSAREQVAALAAAVAGAPGIRFGTVIGRYYAMDRDHRWERVAKAYAALVDAEGTPATDPVQAIADSYATGINDEFVLPAIIAGFGGMADGDGILMANFRADRAREILSALLEPSFTGFARSRTVAFAAAAGMVEYASELNPLLSALFPPKRLERVLGDVLASAGLSQLRIAETEKYPHVTYFFNGGDEQPFPEEQRVLVPSPKVATYDLQPEMSAPELTDRLVAAIEGDGYDFILVNFANPDMVGHCGDLGAAIRAVEAVDTALGRLEAAVRGRDGTLLVTADHGNCELMRDPETGGPHTAHTLNRVPLLVVNGPPSVTGVRDGCLADVAPTLLALLGLEQPAEMSGQSLLVAAK